MRISDWSSDVCSSDLIDGSFYQPQGDRVVLAGRARVGTIWGADRDTIAPSRRVYAGGGGSVRGYGYQDIGPRDANDDPIGGRGLDEVSVEARLRFGEFGGENGRASSRERMSQTGENSVGAI